MEGGHLCSAAFDGWSIGDGAIPIFRVNSCAYRPERVSSLDQGTAGTADTKGSVQQVRW